MRVGISMFNQALHGLPDHEVVQEEIRLAVLAEELGFDFVSWPEHHFESYSIAPDNIMLLTAVAAQTSVINLMIGVVVVPWWDPLRVAERVLLLDNISGGRVMLGLGRGLARKEYEAFRIDISEARARFEEGAPMILRALETGIMEGDGPYYKQPRVELRPGPYKSFEGRVWGVAMSPPSTEMIAQIGGRLTQFMTQDWEHHLAMYDQYTKYYREIHGEEPPAMLASDLSYCHADAEVAEREMRKYLTAAHNVETSHYELDSADMAAGKIKGYESYAEAAKVMRSTSVEDLVSARIKTQAFGTPDQILEIYRKRLETVPQRDLTLMITSAIGGMPYKQLEESMRLYAKEVIPEVKRMQKEMAKDVAEPEPAMVG